MENVHLVALNQPLKGFRNFISSWILTLHDLTIVVDPGPRYSIPILMDALEKQSVKRIDYILLTHIHIDHAGGAGLLLKHYPDAQIICHPKGISHMIDPTKLWEGSKKVLGNIARVYGEIEPVPEKNICYRNHIEVGKTVVHVLQTPGHAPHHLCYQINDILFAGEVAGINYPIENSLYLRIATPPVFDYDVYLNSLKKAAAADVSHICFAHYGHRQDVKNVFDTAFDQLENWMATVEKHYRAGTEHFEKIVFEELLKNDRGIAHYHALPEDIQEREKYFSLNSIRGMQEYLIKCNDA
jgi:glyoxylase-like metal-dependent hydrolase (beta-lactamase superfamily II)